MLVEGMCGTECVAWRKSYGTSGGLHFGRLVPKSLPSKRSRRYKDEGQWILHLWDCDRILTVWKGGELESRSLKDEVQMKELALLEGHRVAEVSLDPETLLLTIAFAEGSMLKLLVDEDCEPDLEQWNLVLPSRNTIVVWPLKQWGMMGSED